MFRIISNVNSDGEVLFQFCFPSGLILLWHFYLILNRALQNLMDCSECFDITFTNLRNLKKNKKLLEFFIFFEKKKWKISLQKFKLGKSIDLPMLSFPMNTLVSSLMKVAEATARAANTRSSLIFAAAPQLCPSHLTHPFYTTSICLLLIITAHVIIYCCSFVDNLLGVLMSYRAQRCSEVRICSKPSLWRYLPHRKLEGC